MRARIELSYLHLLLGLLLLPAAGMVITACSTGFAQSEDAVIYLPILDPFHTSPTATPSEPVTWIKRTASDADEKDQFGNNVDISGDRAIVGAFHDGELGEIAGAAYIFEREGTSLDGWREVAKLTPEGGGANGWFGIDVAIDGNYAVVGASHQSSLRGAAYIFHRGAGEPPRWHQVQRLSAPNGERGDWFGATVAIEGDTVVVAATKRYKDVEPGTLIGGDSGRVYVFERSPEAVDAWELQAEIEASDARPGDVFGSALDLASGRLIVGAPGPDDAGERGWPGGVYVYEPVDASFAMAEETKLAASDGGSEDQFGALNVAGFGDTLVVGAFTDEDLAEGAGSAYVFAKQGQGPSGWDQRQKLSASQPGEIHFFGVSQALNEDTLAIAAHFEGAVYLFQRDEAGSWTEAVRLTAPDEEWSDMFGMDVAIDGDTLLVGDINHQERAPYAGAAYFFDLRQVLP